MQSNIYLTGAVTNFQVNVAPALSIFPKALAIAPNFQQYRIKRVYYDVYPLQPMNTLSTAGYTTTAKLYVVPIMGY